MIKQPGKVVFTAGQFVRGPALNEPPVVFPPSSLQVNIVHCITQTQKKVKLCKGALPCCCHFDNLTR